MKHHSNAALTFCIVTLSLLATPAARPQGAAGAGSDNTLSMTIPEQSIQTGLKQFFQNAGKRCRIAPDLQGTVGLTFHDLSFGAALNALLRTAKPPPQCDIVNGVYLFSVKPPRPGVPQPFTGHISGRVMLEAGRPAAGFQVRAYFEPFLVDHKAAIETFTDAQGHYALTVQCLPNTISSFGVSGPLRTFPTPDWAEFILTVETGGRPLREPLPQPVHLDSAPGHAVSGVNFVLTRKRAGQSPTP